MSMTSWAKREVELACKKEAPERKEGEWDYGCACYESALKAFNSLMEDEHSGFSLGITKSILNRLLDGKPLTPIKDEDDIWGSAYTYQSADDRLVYQCSRMPSLFKYVNQDGSVTYSDIDRYICVDLNDPDNRYQFSFIKQIIDEMFPITMPYMPDNQPWKIHCEDFLFDKNCGDFDTIGIFYVTKPDGKRLYVNRYFVEKDGDWKECDVAEYLWRRERRIK